jgi:uncharacterized protein Usg
MPTEAYNVSRVFPSLLETFLEQHPSMAVEVPHLGEVREIEQNKEQKDLHSTLTHNNIRSHGEGFFTPSTAPYLRMRTGVAAHERE